MQNLQNTPSFGKKDNILLSKNNQKLLIDRLFETLYRYHSSENALVYLNNIYNNTIKHPRWKDLPKIAKLAYVFWYATEQRFYAITCLFSLELIEKLKKQRFPEDYLRRKLNSNFKKDLGYIPQYCFIIEDLNKNGHLHGIIESNINLKELRYVLKYTFFGENYRNSSVNNFNVKLEPLHTSEKWLAYILKRNSFEIKLFPIYTSRELTKAARFRYQILKEERIII